MADNNRTDQRNGTGNAEVARRGGPARMASEALRAGTPETTPPPPEETLPEAARAGRAVVAEVARSAVEAARQATETGAEAARRSDQAGAEFVRRTGEAAGQGAAAATAGSREATRSLWAGSEEMRRIMPGFAIPPGGMLDLPQAVAGFMGEMMRANMAISQEFFRLANPVAVIEMQQRLVRGYLDAIVAGQATLMGAARRTSEDAQQLAGAARDRNA
jgi:hypothetical protein